MIQCVVLLQKNVALLHSTHFVSGALYLAIPWSNGRRLRRGGPGLRN